MNVASEVLDHEIHGWIEFGKIWYSFAGNSQKKMSTEAGGKASSFLAWLPHSMDNNHEKFYPRVLVIAKRKWLPVFLSPKVAIELHCTVTKNGSFS